LLKVHAALPNRHLLGVFSAHRYHRSMRPRWQQEHRSDTQPQPHPHFVLRAGWSLFRIHCKRACRSISQHSGENDSHHMGAVGRRRRPKQWVNRGAGAILLGSPGQADAVLLHEQMLIGRSDINFPCLDRCSVKRLCDIERAGRA
jgi:hypothetical protein